MSVRLRIEQCCAETGCPKPARHGDLCTAHYQAASPAVRAVCDLLDRVDAKVAGYEREQKALAGLEILWDLPEFQPHAEAA